ncbi:MAG: hypothetical protein VX463_03550 [Pseudomonadota bacterium]|nr:hypothetical protein [Pseudomonadota bacterium]
MIVVAVLLARLALGALTLRARSRAGARGAARDRLAAHALPLLRDAFPEAAEAVSLEWCAALWRAYEDHALAVTGAPDTGAAFARLGPMEADPAQAPALRARYLASVEPLSPEPLRARLREDPEGAARRIYDALAEAAAKAA